MAVPECAHRCTVVQTLVLREARRGPAEAAVRLGIGLTPEYVPPIPPRTTSRPLQAMCAACGHIYKGPGAITTARECADLDTGTTD